MIDPKEEPTIAGDDPRINRMPPLCQCPSCIEGFNTVPNHIHGPYIVTEWEYINQKYKAATVYRCSVCMEPWEGNK